MEKGVFQRHRGLKVGIIKGEIMRTHFNIVEQEKKNVRQGSYDLDSSLINCCNEGLYNLPSVPQFHVFCHARNITWGGWMWLQQISGAEEHEAENAGLFCPAGEQNIIYSTLMTDLKKKKLNVFLQCACLTAQSILDRKNKDSEGTVRWDKYHTSPPCILPPPV